MMKRTSVVLLIVLLEILICCIGTTWAQGADQVVTGPQVVPGEAVPASGMQQTLNTAPPVEAAAANQEITRTYTWPAANCGGWVIGSGSTHDPFWLSHTDNMDPYAVVADCLLQLGEEISPEWEVIEVVTNYCVAKLSIDDSVRYFRLESAGYIWQTHTGQEPDTTDSTWNCFELNWPVSSREFRLAAMGGSLDLAGVSTISVTYLLRQSDPTATPTMTPTPVATATPTPEPARVHVNPDSIDPLVVGSTANFVGSITGSYDGFRWAWSIGNPTQIAATIESPSNYSTNITFHEVGLYYVGLCAMRLDGGIWDCRTVLVNSVPDPNAPTPTPTPVLEPLQVEVEKSAPEVLDHSAKVIFDFYYVPQGRDGTCLLTATEIPEGAQIPRIEYPNACMGTIVEFYASGSYTFELRVTDAVNQALTVVTILVEVPNLPPQVSPVKSEQTVWQDVWTVISMDASDPDGDELTGSWSINVSDTCIRLLDWQATKTQILVSCIVDDVSLTYTVTDPEGLSASASMWLRSQQPVGVIYLPLTTSSRVAQ